MHNARARQDAQPRSSRRLNDQRLQARTRDAAAALLEQLYGSQVRAEFYVHDNLSVQFTPVSIGTIKLVRADVTAVSSERLLESCVQIYLPKRGALRQRTRTSEIVADRNTLSVMRPDEATRLDVIEGAAFVLTIPLTLISERASLAQVGEANSNVASQLPDQLTMADPLVSALSRHAQAAFTEMSALRRVGHAPLVVSGYEDLLLNLVTSVLLPRTTNDLKEIENFPSPAMRARDYIAEHAMEPIELAQLSADLGVSMRALQSGFQRHFGMSARDFILECRLDAARSSLLSLENEENVITIALSCGFGNLSHFAAKYRDKFQELPSETLRRKRSGSN